MLDTGGGALTKKLFQTFVFMPLSLDPLKSH